jgi:large subunit ribosomal protein L20
MARVKRGTTVRARHKKVLKLASGYRGRSSRCYRIAIQRVYKALQYAYRDRRCRKREMRALWIQRINAATRQLGITYGDFMHGLSLLNFDFNRKILADMAVQEPDSFATLVSEVKKAHPCRQVFI